MKFVKGAIIGSMATATAVMLYKDMSKRDKTKLIKKGKQFARKIGMME